MFLGFWFALEVGFGLSGPVIGNLLGPELAELIHQRDATHLREVLCGFMPADIAEIISDLGNEDKAVLLRVLPGPVAAEVFEHLSVEDQEKLLRALGSETVADILNEMQAGGRTALLEELPSAATQKLLNLLNPEQRKIATDLLGYPRGSIGRRMTPLYVAIQQDWNVGQVLEHLRAQAGKRSTMNQLYVVDGRGRLVDFVRLRDIVSAPLKTPVLELLEHKLVFLRVTDDQETAVGTFKKYGVTLLPLVDSNDVLVGVVTVDDVLHVAEKEATEDIQKLGGMEALDGPYLKIGMVPMIKKRAGWLAVLFLGEMLTATAMGHFEDEIAKAVVLALFVPLIISSGGNAGSQATSLIIRAMAIQDVRLRDWWRVMRREVVAGLVLGAVLAVIALIRILLWPHKEQVYGPHYMLVALTVACSLVGVVLFGSVAGSMLPFLLRRLGFDPAAASAPFVATLVDVTGLVIYFSIAYQILHGTLL